MEIITHGAFEYVCVQTKIFPGDIINADPFVNNVGNFHHQDNGYLTVQTKNHQRVRNTETNVEYTIPEGSYACKDMYDLHVPDGRYELINNNYFEMFCFSPYLNSSHLPLHEKFQPFKLMAGEEVTVTMGKRIFMMEGAVTIAGKNYTNVNRLKFTTSNKKVHALRDTYGVYVK